MPPEHDPRRLELGSPIPGLHYCDQPYLVVADDGAWVCVMTTSAGHEGETDQHVRIMRSTDNGENWSQPVRLEDPDQPENSYAVLLKTSFGRIYCFYNFNADNVREAKTEDGRAFKRVDSLGHYVFRYSDDHGKSWSADRHELPVREFAIDRENVYGGKLRYFWNVGRPLISDNGNDVFLGLHKIGAIGDGFQVKSEGVFIHSDNILHEPDISRLNFETLPDGDIGLRLPRNEEGVAEEQSLVELSDGSLFCVYRTKKGFPACAYSRDRGHTWTTPQFMTRSPDGPRIKHPRAANFAWRCSNGMFLYWFHNHGGEPINHSPGHSLNGWVYEGRNPGWLMSGIERDSPDGRIIEWSRPEIALYDDDPMTRISYPDLLEQDGRFFISQTQKTQGRVNEISSRIIQGLFDQFDRSEVSRDGLLLEWSAAEQGGSRSASANSGSQGATAELPDLPFFVERDRHTFRTVPLRTGVTIDFWLQLRSLEVGQVILKSDNGYGHGWSVTTTAAGALELAMADGDERCTWDCDPGLLQAGRMHHVAIIIDSGPRIIGFVVDGKLCDGGDVREYGWGRFSSSLRTMKGGPRVQIHPSVAQLRVYDRALLVTEAVGAWRHERQTLAGA